MRFTRKSSRHVSTDCSLIRPGEGTSTRFSSRRFLGNEQNMDRLVCSRKGKSERQSDRKRARSASFSATVPEQSRQAGTRRSSIVTAASSKLAGHHHGMPLPAWFDNVQLQDYPWPHLPGKAVGYSRSWMQNNPWPDLQVKGTGSGSKRSFFHNRAHREGEGRSSEMKSLVPGGSVFDPLNLRAVALGEELPGTAPSTPEPEHSRFDMPANNFIPTDTSDPLGLLKDVDDTTPLFLKYDPHRTKRKRSKTKKREVTSVGDAGASHASGSESGAVAQQGVSAPPNATVTSSSVPAPHHSDTEPTEAGKGDSGDCMEVESTSGRIAETVVGMEVESVRPCDGSGGHSSGGREDNRDIGRNSRTDSQGDEVSSKPGPSSSPNASLVSQMDCSYTSEQEPLAGLKHFHRKNLSYPVPVSPLDEYERVQIPRNRRALKKALRIEPLGPEETKKVIKEEERKHREFKRLWRYPNLKSPEDDDEEPLPSSVKPSTEVLKINTDLPAENFRPVLSEPLSRTVDSIISPVFRPRPSQLCRRRRAISECSGDRAGIASKVLNFDPAEVSAARPTPSSVSPKKQRRLSSRSGRSHAKGKSPQKPKSSPIKFAKNAAYKHGNYYRYYGYRTPEVPDFRLYYFRREWFEGKDVLDIGCNAGEVTLAVARLFHPQKIVGMDIDPNLIRIARQNIRSHQTKANMHQMEKYPVSTNEYGPIEPLPALTNPSNLFPKNIMFMQGNYVLEREEQLNYVREEYDLILALSITKWLHLNHGDEGLKRAFNRMFQQLRPGGRLILEPQPWPSYRRRKKLSPTIYKNYNNIKLKPDKFSEYLINTVGFCKREFLGKPFNPSKGFQRPLFLFTKYKESSDTPPQSTSFLDPPPRPPPLYSISERIAFLAGYSGHSSTPGQATPGFGTPGFGTPNQHTPGWGAPRYGPLAQLDWGAVPPSFPPPREVPESTVSSCSNRSSPCSSSSETGDSWSFAGDSQDSGQVGGESFYLEASDMSHDRSSLTGEQGDLVNGSVESDAESCHSLAAAAGAAEQAEEGGHLVSSSSAQGTGASPMAGLAEEQSPLVDGVAEELSLVGEGGEVASPSVEGMMEESSLMAEGMGVGSSPPVPDVAEEASRGPFSLAQDMDSRSVLGAGLYAGVGEEDRSPFSELNPSPGGDLGGEGSSPEAAAVAIDSPDHTQVSRTSLDMDDDTVTVVTRAADSTVSVSVMDNAAVDSSSVHDVDVGVTDDGNVPDSTVLSDDVPGDDASVCSLEVQVNAQVSGADSQTGDLQQPSSESASPTDPGSPEQS